MKVSIITATYNSEKNIQRTISSVAGQDYYNIEYIIIDGGSTDNTLDIIKSNKNHITKYISEKDSGIYDALNKGINLATGNIIGFLHSDDEFANNMVISNIINYFENYKTDIVYGDLIYQSTNKNREKIIRYWRSKSYKNGCLKFGWMPPHPTVYCKKKIYDEWGVFNNKFKISADYDFILRVFKQETIIKTHIPATLVKMEIGGTSNKSLVNIIRKSKEDLKAIHHNKIGGFLTLILKNIRKIIQFSKLNFKNLK